MANITIEKTESGWKVTALAPQSFDFVSLDEAVVKAKELEAQPAA